jgi:hypothetical protein
VPKEIDGVAVTRIGSVIAGRGTVRAQFEDAWIDASTSGFEHDGTTRGEDLRGGSGEVR